MDGSLMVKPEWDRQSSTWKKAFMGRFMAICEQRDLKLTQYQRIASPLKPIFIDGRNQYLIMR